MAQPDGNSILGWFLNRGRPTAIKNHGLRTSNPLTSFFWGWQPEDGDFDPSGDGLIRAYLASLWAYRCINLRANAISAIPLIVKTLDGKYIDKQGRPQDTPITSKVNQHIIQRMIGDGTRRMWRSIEADRCIFGTGFATISREGLTRLNPYTVEIEKNAEGVELFRQRLDGAVAGEWKPAQMIYLFDYDPQDDLGSLSPLMFALRAIGSEVSVGEFVKAYFANDATPSGLLTTDQPMNDPDMENTQRWWNKLFAGAGNKGKVGIVGNGLHYEKIQGDLENMAITDLRLEIRREVTAAFGVPMTIAGADEAANYSTSKEQHIAFYTETIIPQLETVIDGLNEQLVPVFDKEGRLAVTADLSGISVLQEAKTETSTRLTQGFGAGVYSLNEVRELEGLKTSKIDYINVPNVGIIKVDDLPKLADANVKKLLNEANPQPAPDMGGGYGGDATEPEPPADEPPADEPPAPASPVTGIEPEDGGGEGPSDTPKAAPYLQLLSRRAPGIHYDAADRKAVDLDAAPAAYATIPLGHNKDLVELQNRLKMELGGDKAGEWQNPLHLTLVCVDAIDDARLHALTADIQPRAMKLTGLQLGMFPDKGKGRVLYLEIVKTPELESYQRAVYDAFMAVGVEVSPYSTPEAYKPHVTLCYLSPNTSAPEELCDLPLEGDVLQFTRDNYQTDTALQAMKAQMFTPKTDSNLTRTVALTELKQWEKKVKSKGIKAKFDTLGVPSAVKMFLKWDLANAGDDKDAIKAAFDRAEAVIKSDDPTPEEFNEFWKGLDDTAGDLEGAIASILEDKALRERLAAHLDNSGDPATLPQFFETETDRMVDALVGTEDNPGPLAKVYLAGAVRGQELADKLQAKGENIIAASKKGLVSTAWDIVHKQAMTFARQYAYNLVKGMNETTQTAFRDGISSWVQQGGTLPRLTDFLMGRLKGLEIPKGWSPKKIEWAGSRNRARLIAQTESTRAFTEGNVTRWQQIGVKSIKWRTQNDRLVCQFCRDMNGSIGSVGKGFAVPVKHQAKYGAVVKMPAHAGDRCFPAPVTANPSKPMETISVDPKVSKKKPGSLVVGEKGT